MPVQDHPPPKLYKYLTADRIDVLRNGTIRFTQPSALNDPFEHAAKLDGLFERSASGEPDSSSRRPNPLAAFLGYALRTVIRSAEQPLRQMGHGDRYAALSLSERGDSLLMWAHYSDEHKGFSLELETSHPFFDRRASPADLFNSLHKVIYQTERPTLSFNKYARALLYKSPHWEYEREWRMIVSTAAATHQKESLAGTVHLFDFPPECVSAVNLGCRMKQEVIDEFAELLRDDPRYEHVILRYATQDPDHYALKFVGEGRIHYLRALEAAETEDEATLVESLDRAIHLEPENAEYPFIRGAFAFAKGEHEAARRDLELTVELHPLSSRYWLLLHELAMEQGDEDRSLDAIRRAIEQDRDNAGLYVRRAKIFLNAEAYTRAIRDFTRAIELDEESVSAFWGRASAYHKLKKFGAARADTDTAISLAPEVTKFYRARAQLSEHEGKSAEAIADLTRALELEPENVEVLLSRAEVHDSTGDLASALTDVERATQLSPGDPKLHRLRESLARALRPGDGE